MNIVCNPLVPMTSATRKRSRAMPCPRTHEQAKANSRRTMSRTVPVLGSCGLVRKRDRVSYRLQRHCTTINHQPSIAHPSPCESCVEQTGSAMQVFAPFSIVIFARNESSLGKCQLSIQHACMVGTHSIRVTHSLSHHHATAHNSIKRRGACDESRQDQE
jgi:hypothetical protein